MAITPDEAYPGKRWVLRGMTLAFACLVDLLTVNYSRLYL